MFYRNDKAYHYKTKALLDHLLLMGTPISRWLADTLDERHIKGLATGYDLMIQQKYKE